MRPKEGHPRSTASPPPVFGPTCHVDQTGIVVLIVITNSDVISSTIEASAKMYAPAKVASA